MSRANRMRSMDASVILSFFWVISTIIDIEPMILHKSMHRQNLIREYFNCSANSCQLEQKFRPNYPDDRCSTPMLPTNSSHPLSFSNLD